MAQFGGKPVKCPRCSKTVYMAEEIIAAGRKYHKTCLKCYECNKHLEPRALNDRDGEIFCNRCYKTKFGPKGYGHGVGAGVLSSEAPANSNRPAPSAPPASSGPACVSCGARGQSGQFCTQCGKPPANAPPPRPPKPQVRPDVCLSCGAVEQSGKFCTQCGQAPQGSAQPPAASASSYGGPRHLSHNNEKQKPTWVSDDFAIACMKCSKEFSFTNRRHHCRACGCLVCASCSPNKMSVPWEDGNVRVCNQCFET